MMIGLIGHCLDFFVAYRLYSVVDIQQEILIEILAVITACGGHDVVTGNYYGDTYKHTPLYIHTCVGNKVQYSQQYYISITMVTSTPTCTHTHTHPQDPQSFHCRAGNIYPGN